MATKKQDYGNDSISSLKGADRVRKRPGVIFGSDGLDGCEHAVFEILSNSIDEAREGHGRVITVTRYNDRSIQVEDMGRGCPVDWNEKEQRYNWELVYCELYAGGKYDNLTGDNYEYSLGLNGLGACATQYASRYMDVTVWRDGFEYKLHFERGEIVGGLEKTPLPKSQVKKTGTRTRWLPDLDVFTDIAIPAEYFTDVLRRQAVVNEGITFKFRDQQVDGSLPEEDFVYEHGIQDYVAELAGEGALTAPVFWQAEKRGRDRVDKPEYKVKLSAACCFSNKVQVIEHYHNSSWLEHGGAPEKATKSAFVSAVDKYLREQNKYQKNESKITWQDIEDCLIFVSNNFSTQTSYENQTKKSITNKFVQEAMTEFLRTNLEIYFIENHFDAEKIQAVFEVWRGGPLAGYLIDITAEILKVRDAESGKLLLDLILDAPGQKGTGRWTSETALETGTPVPTLTQAVYQRNLDAAKELRLLGSRLLAAPEAVEPYPEEELDEVVAALESALYCSKICAYAQGFELLKAAAQRFDWPLRYGEIALLWRGGCIIRADFLGEIKKAYDRNPKLENLMFDEYFRAELDNGQEGWRLIAADALLAGVAMPAMLSAIGYYDSRRRANSPSNLIQAQRDFFGAHTLERKDRPRGEFFHHEWNQPGVES